MTGSLKDQTRARRRAGSGLARAIILAARDEGAQVIAAGRHQERPGTLRKAQNAQKGRAK